MVEGSGYCCVAREKEEFMEIGKMLGTVQAVGGPKREDKALV